MYRYRSVKQTKRPTKTTETNKKIETKMLVKPQRLHVDHHRYLRTELRQRLLWDNSPEDARDTESMLILFLERRRKARALRRQREEKELNLPETIASGLGRRVWKRSSQQRHGHVVYQDAEAPDRLLHVIPDDDDDDDDDGANVNTNNANNQQKRDCHAPPLPPTNGNMQQTEVLRCPAPLSYAGMPLPVAPSLPPQVERKRPRYLVRPRFPTPPGSTII